MGNGRAEADSRARASMSQGSLFGRGSGRRARRWQQGRARSTSGRRGGRMRTGRGWSIPQPKPRGLPAAGLPGAVVQYHRGQQHLLPPAEREDDRAAGSRDVADRPDFLYTAKLYQGFTHERGREHWSAADARTFREGIAPLAEAGRLGALLVQFPWSFHYNEASRDHVRGLVDEFGDLPLVVEVRSGEWVRDGAARLHPLARGRLLQHRPAARLRGNIPLTAHAFGPVGYLRLHGRNAAAWFAEDAGRDQRYDYLYSPAELDEHRQGARQDSRAGRADVRHRQQPLPRPGRRDRAGADPQGGGGGAGAAGDASGRLYDTYR